MLLLGCFVNVFVKNIVFKIILPFFEIGQQAIVMLRLWLSTQGNQATGNVLEKALRRIGREDIVNKCMFNVELVTDEMEQSVAKTALEDVSGFDAFKVII